MVKVSTLPTVTNPPTSSQFNDAMSKITTAFSNTLSRDGSTPNTLSADLDLNGNDVINVTDLSVSGTISVNGATLQTSISGSFDFATRAEFVTWNTDANKNVGMVVNAVGVSYKYDGTSTAISDLLGWLPNGEISPGHFGTVDGTADEVQINLATNYASTLTGNYGAQGVVLKGNYTIAAPILLRTGVRIKGQGWASVTLANSANCNVFETVGFSGYIGGGSYADTLPHGFGIEGITVDGNRANQSPASPDINGNGIAVYGYAGYFRDLVLTNLKAHGWRSEFGQYGEAEAGMESTYQNIKIDTCGRHGVWYKGPHDADFSHVIVIDCGVDTDNTYRGFLFEGYGSLRGYNLHAWHRGAAANRMAYVIEATSVELVNCHFEGGRKLVKANGNVQISNSRYYHSFGTGSCIELNNDYNRIQGIFKALTTANKNTVVEIGPSAIAGASTVDLVVQNSTLGTATMLVSTSSAGNNKIDIWSVNSDIANMKSGTFHNSDWVRLIQRWGSAYEYIKENTYLERTNGVTNQTAQVFKSMTGPNTITGAATLTTANITPGVIFYTGAAANLTMPLGSTLDGMFTANDTAYEFSVINTGSGTATIVTNTGVTVGGTGGSMAVATGSTGRFAVRRSAASTYVVYRVG